MLTQYLKDQHSPKFFEEAIQYKFDIAENYYNGVKKRLFGLKKTTKLQFAKDDALEIYEESVKSIPHHDL